MAFEKSVSLFWRLQKAKYGLVGSKCETCNRLFFPPRPLCSDCRRKGNMVDHQFTPSGKIVSSTVIRTPPDGFEQYAPYAVAIIRLDEGPQITGQVVGDLKTIDTGKAVRAVFRKISEDGDDGMIHYGLKWEVVGNKQ